MEAFAENIHITTVVIPSSVENIGKGSFYQCENLRFIIFKKNSRLKKIESCSFLFAALESVDIPSSVEEIKGMAFNYCRNLRSVNFSKDSRLKRIGYNAFGSTAIESIEIP